MTTERKTILVAGRPVAAVLALGLLAGCSYVPDALNPVEWYQDTVDFFVSDEDAPSEDSGLAADPNAPAPEEFPNLAEVPDVPASGGLGADTANRRYTDEAVAGQGRAVAPLGSTAMAEAPPPPAVPATPVTPAPMQSTASMAPSSMPSAPAGPRPSLGDLASRAPAPAPAPMPPAMRKSFDAGLAQRLPTGEPAQLPANAVMPTIGSDYGTVVISSAGIDTPSSQPVAPTQMAAAPALPGPGAVAGTRTFDIGAQSMPQSGTVKVATILFRNGSANLTARDVSILREVRAIQQQRGGVIRIVGHASSRTRDMDPIHHKMVNFQVSADRADVVAKTLIKLGAAPSQVAVNAVSDTSPLYYEVMPSGEAGNRRAEIFLSY